MYLLDSSILGKFKFCLPGRINFDARPFEATVLVSIAPHWLTGQGPDRNRHVFPSLPSRLPRSSSSSFFSSSYHPSLMVKQQAR